MTLLQRGVAPPSAGLISARLGDVDTTAKRRKEELDELTASLQSVNAHNVDNCNGLRLTASAWVEQQASLSIAVSRLMANNVFSFDQTNRILAIIATPSSSSQRADAISVLETMAQGGVNPRAAVPARTTFAKALLERVSRSTSHMPLA